MQNIPLNIVVYVIDLILIAMILSGLSLSGAKLIEYWRAKSNIAEDLPNLNRFIGSLKVISSTSTLLGLAGTVLAVMSALQTMGSMEVSGNFMAVATPIGLALKSTFLGICGAIPAQACLSYLSVAHIDLINTKDSYENKKADELNRNVPQGKNNV